MALRLKEAVHRFLPITRGALAAFVILTCVNVWGLWNLRVQNDRTNDTAVAVAKQAVRNCETGNESRRAIRDAFDLLIRASQANPPPDQTAEEKARSLELIARFQGDLKRQLGERDCTREGIPNA